MRERLLAGFLLLVSCATAQFVENKGQLDPSVRYAAREGRMTVLVSDASFAVQLHEPAVDGTPLRGATVAYEVEGARVGSRARGAEALPGRFNYLLGSDQRRWVVDVPTWSRVNVSDVRPGVSLDFHQKDGMLEYDVLLAGQASPDDLAIRVRGASALAIDETGALVTQTAAGVLRQEMPAAFRVAKDGSRASVPCRFRLLDHDRFGFELPGHEPGSEVVIDPILTYVGYLSGSTGDEAHAIAVDASGNLYSAGRTWSSNFPLTPGAWDVTLSGATEGFVTKSSPNGLSLVWSTFIGAPGSDLITSIAVNASGQTTISGFSGSGFPTTTGAYDTTSNGWRDTFVTRLNASGNGLLFSTFIGGDNEDLAMGMALDAAGNIYVTGHTMSTNFPTTAGAYDTTDNANWDGFLVKFNPTASALIFSTYFGGSGVDWPNSVALASDGSIVIAGDSDSTNLPLTAGAFDTTANGLLDAFVAKFNAAGSALAFATLIGSSGTDHAMDVALDSADAIYLTGVALPGFPTTVGAFDTSNNNGDAFVAKLVASGNALVYCTFIGGMSTEQGTAIAVDAGGAAYVAGFTNSTNFPTTTGAAFPGYGGGGSPGDAFFAKVAASGNRLDYATYFGGIGYEQVFDLALGSSGAVYIAGSTVSPNLPVPSGDFDLHLGIDEGFMARFDLPIAGTAVLGPGWSPSAPVTALSLAQPPVIGQLVTANLASAPGSSPASIYVSGPAAQTVVNGVVPVYLHVPTAFLLGSVTTSASGTASFSFLLPPLPSLAGLVAYAQAVMLTPTSPFGYEVSNGLSMTIGY